MTQLSWKGRTRAKQDVKNHILWFIGCPSGKILNKKANFCATIQEILQFVSRYLSYRDGSRYSKQDPQARKALRRALYRYIEELKNERYVELTERGTYTLTPLGQKRWNPLHILYSTSALPIVKTIGTFFSFGPIVDGKTQHVDILIRVGDPSLIEIIENDMKTKGISEIKEAQSEPDELGSSLSTMIMMHYKGTFSMLRDIMNKNEAFLEFMSKIMQSIT